MKKHVDLFLLTAVVRASRPGLPGSSHRGQSPLLAVGRAIAVRLGPLLAGVVVLGALWLPGRPAAGLTVTAVTSDNGYPAHQVQWVDAAGLPRSAVLVDQTSAGAGPYTGYLRRLTYQAGGQTRTCTGTDNPAAGGGLETSGDGFIQNHTAAGGDDSSGNGAGVPGTTTVTLAGSSHALITFSMPGYTVGGQKVPTTVQWCFADGRTDPLFTFSQDARGTAGNLGGDSRSPYGDMAYDGDGVGALVGGFSYGDTYKLVTLAANPERVTMATGWRATEPNTIPYALQWAEPATVDAEMGHVATVPITVSDQGMDTQTSTFGGNLFDPRTKNQPGGPLPPAETWAYQIINYSLPSDGSPTDSKRLAWGANFGRVGGFDNYGDTSLDPKQYSQHANDPVNSPLAGSRADGLLLAASTFVVFGPHAGGYLHGTVGQAVTQMENHAQATLTAATGTVATTGPAGVGSAADALVTFQPAGYDPIYATWEVTADANAVDATLTPAAGAPLDHPVFLVRGYTSAQPPTAVTINGRDAAGTDFFSTVDPVGQRLWITANLLVSAPVRLVVTAPAGGGGNPTPTPTPIPIPTPTPTPTPVVTGPTLTLVKPVATPNQKGKLRALVSTAGFAFKGTVSGGQGGIKKVRVELPGFGVQRAQLNADGTWKARFDSVPAGVYQAQVSARDNAGNVAVPLSLRVVVQ